MAVQPVHRILYFNLNRPQISSPARVEPPVQAEMSVPRARMLDLMKAQCQIFGTIYNPERTRMGNKVLRQRLKGPALAAYYPRKLATIQDVKREFGPVLDTWDDKEEDRLEYIEELKQRGKSAPKKKRGPPVQIKKRK